MFNFWKLTIICIWKAWLIGQFASFFSVFWSIYRSLWSKENELVAEIDRLKAEVEKAEKSLDHATPGVSNWSIICLSTCYMKKSPYLLYFWKLHLLDMDKMMLWDTTIWCCKASEMNKLQQFINKPYQFLLVVKYIRFSVAVLNCNL